MRAYLSSFRLGNQPRRLVQLVRDENQAAVILNACDLLSDEERRMRVQQEVAALEALGFSATELDLRPYFTNRDRERELGVLLAAHGLVWVRGGNSFVLRRAMKASGFAKLERGRGERRVGDEMERLRRAGHGATDCARVGPASPRVE